MSGGRRSKAGELLPEPVRGDGCREANQHAGARSPSAVVVPERPVWNGGEPGSGAGRPGAIALAQRPPLLQP